MERIILQLFILFLIPHSIFCVDGYWEQRFPDNPPEGRSGHSMASIGERKVLLVGGIGCPVKYYSDTWLYDYDSNTWTEIKCIPFPEDNLYLQTMTQITKNRVLLLYHSSIPIDSTTGYEVIGMKTWLFDLDSMKWFELDRGILPKYLGNYGICNLSEGTVIYYMGSGLYATLVGEIQNDNDFSSLFIDWRKYLSLLNGDISPHPFPESNMYQHPKFVNMKSGEVLFIPEANFDPIFTLYNSENNKWHRLKFGGISIATASIWAASYSSITDNIALRFGGANSIGDDDSDTTYLIVYTPKDSIITYYEVKSSVKPLKHYFGAAARIDDSTVLQFGGYGYLGDYCLNETWIFHLTDKTDPLVSIEDDYLESAKIYNLENNIYKLENIRSAELYNAIGNFIGKYENNARIDLNSLPRGVYILKIFGWQDAKN